MKTTIRIPVIVRTQDNGDGGYSIRGYNTEQELLDDHRLYRDAAPEDKGRVAKEILTGDDPHENGYISHAHLEIAVVFDGATIPIDPPKLAKPFYFHAGQ